MKIAIIDDGVDKAMLAHPEYIKKRISLQEKAIGHDTAWHGTFCARTLEQCAKDYEIVVVEMVERWDAPASANRLAAALDICLKEDVKLICCSAGTGYMSEYRNLQPVLKRIEKAEIPVISALGNDGKLTLPAAFESVICAMMDWNQVLPPGKCALVRHPFLGSIAAANLQVFPQQKTLKKGNSFAVSVAAGTCISLMQKGVKICPRNLEKIFPEEPDAKKFEHENWGKEEENPVVLIEGMQAAELADFMDDLIWRKDLETVLAGSGDWYPKDDFRFFREEKYGKTREVLITEIDRYINCTLILSAYREAKERTDKWKYDLEICSRKKEICIRQNNKLCRTILKIGDWIKKLSDETVQILS